MANMNTLLTANGLQKVNTDRVVNPYKVGVSNGKVITSSANYNSNTKPTTATATSVPVAATAPATTAPAQTSYTDALSAALMAQQRARQAAFDSAAAQQKAAYDHNVGKVNTAANNALQDAYINKMLANRTMNQEMAAQGLSGGMTESTRAGLLNNYERSRNATENSRMAQIADLGQVYANNIASLRNALNTGMAGDMSQYVTNIANLAAQNAVSGVNTQQNGQVAMNPNLYYQYIEQLMRNLTNA